MFFSDITDLTSGTVSGIPPPPWRLLDPVALVVSLSMSSESTSFSAPLTWPLKPCPLVWLIEYVHPPPGLGPCITDLFHSNSVHLIFSISTCSLLLFLFLESSCQNLIFHLLVNPRSALKAQLKFSEQSFSPLVPMAFSYFYRTYCTVLTSIHLHVCLSHKAGLEMHGFTLYQGYIIEQYTS